jgi:hypothetical protein
LPPAADLSILRAVDGCGRQRQKARRRGMLLAKRFGVLLAALTLMTMALVACTAGPVGSSPSSSGDLTFQTPDLSQLTATPTFPVFTVGAWVSNYSPNANDVITIYVICRVQDQSMKVPSSPPAAGLPVQVILSGPISASLSGTTSSDGIVAIPYVVNDPYVGQPVTIRVHVNYGGQSYQAWSFFTSGPTTPNTVTPATSGTPGAPVPTHTP